MDLILSLFLFIVTPLAFLLTFWRVLKVQDTKTAQLTLFTGMGFGLGILAWFSYQLFFWFPGLTPWFYVLALILCVCTLLLYGRNNISLLLEAYKASYSQIITFRFDSGADKCVVVLICLLITYLFFIGIFFPIVEHDSLVYAIEAKIIARDLSLSEYLNTRHPDSITGFYNESFQIPALQSLYAWIFIFSGSDNDLIIRAISPYFVVCSCLMLSHIINSKFGRKASIYSVLIYLSTPIVMVQGYENSQDPPRLFMLFSALILVSLVTSGKEIKTKRTLLYLSAIAMGLAIFFHLLSAPGLIIYGCMLFFALFKRSIRKREVSISIILIVIFSSPYHYISSKEVLSKVESRVFPIKSYITRVFNNEQYVKEQDRINQLSRKFKKEIQDTTANSANSSTEKGLSKPIAKSDWNVFSRGQGNTESSQLIFGKLQIFTAPYLFGLTYFLFLAGLMYKRASLLGSSTEKILLATFTVYFIVIFFELRKLGWSNPRYIGTSVFVAAYFSGPYIATLFANIRNKVLHFIIIILIILPLFAVVSIKGSKVGITNNGNFLQRFNSFGWVNGFIEEPRTSLTYFLDNYVGITALVNYSFSNDDEKLIHSHDHLDAVLYFNKKINGESKPLVFKNGQYFYYGANPGVYFSSPSIKKKVRRAKVNDEFHALFLKEGITHIIIDNKYKEKAYYANYNLRKYIGNTEYMTIVYRNNNAYIYELNR